MSRYTSPFFKRTNPLWILVAAVACLAVPACAMAQDAPFDLDTSQWMSFDHYKDAVQRGVIVPPQLPLPSPDQAANEAPDAPAKNEAQPSVTASTMPGKSPVIAAPARPLNLPLMPGLNKGYDVTVTSTEDDAPPVISTDAAANAPDDIHVSDKNWQDPAAITRFNRSAGNNDGDESPLDIRMTYLPDSKITPVPSPEHMTAQHKARLALENGMSRKNVKTPQEAAACAAMDAYKKQQLDALQSDRQTLKALQDAIASMGLQKQLGFMTGTNSALNAAGTVPSSIDVPASTTVR
jgi:hypothetical protein